MKKYLQVITVLTIGFGMLILPVDSIFGQHRSFDFDPDLEYASDIPSPKDFLGYELGEEYTPHSDVMRYFKTLAEVSDRMTLETYGETYEGRKLVYAAISSENNQSMMGEIKGNNKRLMYPDSLNSTELDLLLNRQPVMVWLSYNVHGNEASSSEAAMQAAYRLVAAEDSETERMRDEAVTIIDPMLNPDGRDRYVHWYKSSRANMLNTDPNDLEHDEIWPGGRTNHYWFDLNRDWTWLVHPESQGRVAAYGEWMPQVHLDLHEQGFNSNYFTMPGTTPRNQELPDDYEEWADTFGRGTIAEFDKHGISYATREAFDFFYPGYGSSYPSTMGAIGMLAEQGGHSRGGRAVETDDGYILTLRQRIFDHYTNSIATVRTSIENREELLSYFRETFLPENKKGEAETYVIAHNNQDYTNEFINIMLQHDVEIQQAEEEFSLSDARSYWDGSSQNRTFPEGSYIISTDQPRHVFVNTLLKPQLAIDDSVMYDMATWSAPMAYNLDAAWSNESPNVNSSKVTEAREYPSNLKNPEAQYAYVIDWNQRHAPKALAKLWEEGYRVRSTEESFTFEDENYAPGSLVVMKGRNFEKEESIKDDMQRIAEEAKVEIVGFDTGRMDEGVDLGSRSGHPVDKPKVGLMIDSPFNSYTAGQIWFLFDQWTEFGISRLRSDNLSGSGIDEYDVIILPGAYGLSSLVDSTAQHQLEQWVRDGGTLVATESSASFLSKDESGFTPIELVDNKEEDEENGTIDPAAYTPYEARSDSSGLDRIPGSAFKGKIDNTNPLAFGLPEQLFSLKFSTDAFVPSTDFQTVGYYHKDAESLLASGYASQENIENSAGNTFAGVYEMGSGKVALMLDNTQYRMFWIGPARMMQNAAMLLHDF